MALPDSLKVASGSQTSVTWKNTGGDYALSLATLGIAAASQGVKGDLGANYDRIWYAQLQINMDVAPTAGDEVEVFLGFSPSATAGTSNPAALLGTNVAYTGSAAGSIAQTKHQATYIGSLPLTPDADTVIQRIVLGPFTPPFRYVCPFIVNNSDQILEGDEDSHQLVLYSIPEQIQD